MEEYTVGIPANWPGHETHQQEARQNAKNRKPSAETKKKLEGWGQPGFEAWAAAFPVMFLFLFRRIIFFALQKSQSP